ncbi:MAG TPA: PadR family transcriptional regulator [Candidatus Dormibacteraeota bacterium]|nr:PadR family transcriptional regulator [Candidatus Dormibacteraeota bacterium]
MRLYVLSLLGDGERHGYQIIRTLKERIGGDYTPSAGTVYPRLRQLEREGLVRTRQEAGRIFYRLTGAGESALREQATEIQELETEVGRIAHGLATQLKSEVQNSARELQEELHAQSQAIRNREAPAPFSGELHQQLARFTSEWARLVAPDTTPATARAALTAAMEAAVAQLRQRLDLPKSAD